MHLTLVRKMQKKLETWINKSDAGIPFVKLSTPSFNFHTLCKVEGVAVNLKVTKKYANTGDTVKMGQGSKLATNK